MLIHCPKCTFEQPKDDYCAKCGIHIPSYITPEKPLQERAMGSAAFFGFLFVVLILGAGLYFNSKFTGFEQKIEELNITELSQLVESDQAHIDPNQQDFTKRSLPTKLVASLEKRIEVARANDAGPKSLKNTEKEALDWKQHRLKLSFLESGTDLNDSDAEVRQQGTDYQVLKHTKGLGIYDIAAPIAVKSIPINNQTYSFISSTDTGSQLELQLNWKIENHRVLVQVLIAYNITTTSTNIASGLSLSDYVKPGQSITIKGILPRVNMTPQETEITGPLRIYQSPQFLSGDSDFYIHISIPQLQTNKL